MSARSSDPVAGVPAAPPLPADVEALLRRPRLPQVRRHAPQAVATAKAQRWEPIEVLTVGGPSRSPAGTGKPCDPPGGRRVPDRQDLRRLGRGSLLHPTTDPERAPKLECAHRRENLVVCGPSGTGKRSCSRRSANTPSIMASSLPGSPGDRHLIQYGPRPRGPRRHAPPPPRRQHRHQGHRPDPASGPRRDRRHRPAPLAEDAAVGLYRLVDSG